jgi:hypothetical protein
MAAAASLTTSIARTPAAATRARAHRSPGMARYGLEDIATARHVIDCFVAREQGVQNTVDDLEGNICEALCRGQARARAITTKSSAGRSLGRGGARPETVT